MAKFGLLLSDGLVERTVQQHGTQAEGVFAFLFEKALITMAMIDHQGRVMLRYRQMLPLDKVELLKSSVTKQGISFSFLFFFLSLSYEYQHWPPSTPTSVNSRLYDKSTVKCDTTTLPLRMVTSCCGCSCCPIKLHACIKKTRCSTWPRRLAESFLPCCKRAFSPLTMP